MLSLAFIYFIQIQAATTENTSGLKTLTQEPPKSLLYIGIDGTPTEVLLHSKDQTTIPQEILSRLQQMICREWIVFVCLAV